MAESENSSAGSQRFCSNCGEGIDHAVQFCPHCGVAIGSGVAQSTTATGGRKRTDHIKYRNMLVRVLYYIVSLGLYGFYWYFVTLEELHQANGKERSGCLWTFLFFVPIASLFSMWHYSYEYADFVDEKYPGIGIFILWLVFSPAVWFLVQSDLNRAADRNR